MRAISKGEKLEELLKEEKAVESIKKCVDRKRVSRYVCQTSNVCCMRSEDSCADIDESTGE